MNKRERMLLKIAGSKFINTIDVDVLTEMQGKPNNQVEKVYELCLEAEKALKNVNHRWMVDVAIKRANCLNKVPFAITLLKILSSYKGTQNITIGGEL